MLYDLGFFIFSIIYLPALIFKGKLHRDFGQRFGIYDAATAARLKAHKPKMWIQAVSVGEVALCKNLIPLLKERFPGYDIVLSTITKTGNDLAKKLFSQEAVIIYFPLDFSFIIRRTVKLMRPKFYVMIETEIWPNLLRELARNKIPSILINGRISDRSIGKYRLAKPFLRKALELVNVFCMQSPLDAERIRELGAPADRVKVTGTMKFDIDTMVKHESGKKIREFTGLKSGEELFVAGSTHKGEDAIIIRVYQDLVKDFPKLKLLIAPRHIDRAKEIRGLAEKLGAQVHVLDTIGQLNDAYSIATLVFVGGSLVRHGGQNPIEPAVFERPILFGPHMFNFRTITEIFLNAHAAIQVKDEKELLHQCRVLLRNGRDRTALGQAARKVIFQNRGAAEKNLQAIAGII